MRNKIVYANWTFTDEDIQSGNMYLAMALMSDSLEANTFTATVLCSDRSIINFERNTPLTYYYKEQQRGIFYVQSITRNGPESYTISATSAIGLLIEGLHYGGIYTGQTVAEVLPSICGTVPYVVKTNLRDIALYGWLPVASPRDNLSQVLFAIGASIRTDLDGVLHIETLWDGIVGNIGKDRLYNGAQVNYDAKVTQIVVTEHQYMEGGDEESLFEGTAAEGDIITFDDPMYDLTPSGLTILESGANYAKVSAGTGTLTGRKYIHNTREVARAVSQANEPNVITVTDATLVSLVNSVAVAERLVNYYQWTETIESGVVYDGELPGNRSNAWHPYDEEVVSGCLESADVNLSNTLRAEERILVGYVPPKQEQIVTYDHRELLTGSGTWTVPEGVTEVRVVLIGGGGAGFDGEDGEDGTYNGFGASDYDNKTVTPERGQTGSVTANASCSLRSSSGGAGGAGGAAGTPGKVYQYTQTVSPGENISFQCGSAGEANGSLGSDTVFGDNSSQLGESSTIGYIDPITAEEYAKGGSPGLNGGAGGNTAQDGQTTGKASGGDGYGSGNDSLSNEEYKSSPYPVTRYTCNGTINYSYAGAGGGGAGGDSGDVRASGGSAAFRGSFSYDIGFDAHTYACRSRAHLYPPDAGGGGHGASGSDGKTFGSAGSGGGGGGGGGAAGTASLSASMTVTVEQHNVEGYGLGVGSATADVEIEGGRNGSGGPGGVGGSGAPGCIILYYGVQETVPSGPFVDKNNKTFLDKFGRLIVV